jgi:DNA invertase Pin-like site-specific DNA recombinase
MQNVYGYIRVSGKKQEDGASLPEQKRIIKEYAKSNNLNIIHFYEETKTAAKRGRPFFSQMLENLKQDKAQGVIMHKIDRSARNLHDWAAIGDLIDNNIAVYFAHESLNLNERGGRLSADIQAVMASDYIRNLKQEILKGIRGRLKDGYYPSRAPVGYKDNGRGQLKTIHPKQGKLVKELFNLYASKEHNVITLADEMYKRGLRNYKGNRVCKSGISRILNNPFYIGVIKMKDEFYEGKHEPLISTQLFKRVQLILTNRQNNRIIKHDYLFRKHLKCGECKYLMSGERQKGRVYYRCQTKGCSTKSVREDYVEHFVKNCLSTISLSRKEISHIETLFDGRKEHLGDIIEERVQGLTLQLSKYEKENERLLDAYLENIIDSETLSIKKEQILFKKREIQESISNARNMENEGVLSEESKFLELCYKPLKLYDSAILEEKREMLKNITSNLTVRGRSISFTMLSPYRELANRDILVLGDVTRGNTRTMTSQITYTDNNTSGIILKPLNKKQIKRFVDILFAKTSPLNVANFDKKHAIPKDHPSTK